MIETDAANQPYEVGDLGPEAVLDMFADAERQDREAGRRKLRLAYQWAVLHPGRPENAADWGDGEQGPARECDVPLGGDGAPLVHHAAVPALGAALGVSTMTAQSLLGDALDLVHRLPMIWARVESLEVPAWKARRVAVLAHSLSYTAARWVDAQLAGRIHRVGFPTIENVVTAAVAVFHPDRLPQDDESAKAAWRVELRHPSGGEIADNSWFEATADTGDLVALHDLVRAVAEALRLAGDEDTLDQRKAKALGVIGRGEHSELLAQTAADPDDASEPATSRSAVRWRRRSRGGPTRIYVHLHARDLHDPAVGQVEGIGPVTVARIREWAAAPGVRVQPVLHMDRVDAVDCHDPPGWMAELVRLRDPHCVFPGCQRSSRSCDLDHIDPYQPHGPPGQTHQGNLAPLCRGHHNAKTHHGWRYRRLPDGSYLWADPRGGRYVVTAETSTILDAG